MMVHLSIRRLGTVFDLGNLPREVWRVWRPKRRISHVVVGAGLNVVVDSTGPLQSLRRYDATVK
jgi:hypothetical protein